MECRERSGKEPKILTREPGKSELSHKMMEVASSRSNLSSKNEEFSLGHVKCDYLLGKLSRWSQCEYQVRLNVKA